METFTPTSYTLECVATGREFEDTGWILTDPQCKEPSLVRARYAKRQLDVKPADGTLYYFVGSDKLRFRQPVLPGDQLVLEARFLSVKRSIWKFECRASVDGKEVCSAEIICAERKL